MVDANALSSHNPRFGLVIVSSVARFIVVSANDAQVMGEVEMPNATTVKYACKRIAEQFGWDPYEHNFFLFTLDSIYNGGPHVDEDSIVADLDGQKVALFRENKKVRGYE